MDVTKEDITKAITEVLKENAVKDPRITDIDFFWQIIPNILGGCITNSLETRPAMQKAFLLAREAIGQACTMGICKPVTVLSDGNQLAMMPSMAYGAAPPAQGQRPMPGSGGMVMQYPMHGQGAPIGGQGIPAGGMVAQYPMDMAGGAPFSPQGGAAPGQGNKGVMTRQFPMDPVVAQALAPLVGQGPQPGTPAWVAAQAQVPQYAPPPPQGYAQPHGYAPQAAPPGYAAQQPVYAPQPPQGYGPPPQQVQYAQPQPPPGGFQPVVAPQGQPVLGVPLPPGVIPMPTGPVGQ